MKFTKTDKTAVIFRMFDDGDVIAFFPGIAGTMDIRTCLSYASTGQHASANIDLIDVLDKPTNGYKELKEELESIGYVLEVYEVVPGWAYNRRAESLELEVDMKFNRTDICNAYRILEWDYNVNGILQERPSNIRRKEATAVQLHRIGAGYNPTRDPGEYGDLSENGKAIYNNQIKQLNLKEESS